MKLPISLWLRIALLIVVKIVQRKIKMKKSMECAIERFQFFAKELHDTANYNYYEHHEMVEG